MKEFLIQNWFVNLLAIAFLGYAIYLAATKQWTKIHQLAYALMLSAERLYADNEGKKKFESVFEKLYYDLIPPWLRLFISPESIREKIQEWYDIAKDYLSDGQVNGPVK